MLPSFFPLPPLPTGDSSLGLGINTAGEVIGMSYTYGFPPGVPTHATLWRRGQPIALAPAAESSRGLSLNDRGDVLYAVDRGGSTIATVHWRDGVRTDLTAELGVFAVALNARGRAVGFRGGQPVVVDLATRVVSALPEVDTSGRTFPVVPTGIDDAGRVLGYDDEVRNGRLVVYVLPDGHTAWRTIPRFFPPLTISRPGMSHVMTNDEAFRPLLGRDGFVLVTGPAAFCNLNGAFLEEERLPIDDRRWSLVPLGANRRGDIVGQGIGSDPMAYWLHGGQPFNLQDASFFGAQGAVRVKSATGINDGGAIVVNALDRAGTPDVRHFAWVSAGAPSDFGIDSLPPPGRPSPVPDPRLRSLAVALFNRVWALMDKLDRTAAETDEMIHAAHASRHHWGEVGTAVNLARGEWQISRVYAVLGRAEPALQHAYRCLQLCLDNGIGDFDRAFAHEAVARAAAVAGDRVTREEHLARAAESLTGIADPADRAQVERDLATIPRD